MFLYLIQRFLSYTNGAVCSDIFYKEILDRNRFFLKLLKIQKQSFIPNYPKEN